MSLSANYVIKNVENQKWKKFAQNALHMLDLFNIASAVADTSVSVGDDILRICIQRGVKHPMKESEAKQSVAEFVVGGTNKLSYVSLGSEYGHEDYLK